jgi:hypothetical protein
MSIVSIAIITILWIVGWLFTFKKTKESLTWKMTRTEVLIWKFLYIPLWVIPFSLKFLDVFYNHIIKKKW